MRSKVANDFGFMKLMLKFLYNPLPVYSRYKAGTSLHELYRVGRMQVKRILNLLRDLAFYILFIFYGMHGGVERCI